MDSVLYTFVLDRLSNGGREVLIDDPPRRVRNFLLQCKTHMADAATNVNEEWNFGLQPVAKFLLEGIDIEEHLLAFTIGHHPLEEVVEARRHRQGPIKRHLICSVAFLKRTVGAIGRVLVVGLSKEFGQDLPTRQDVVMTGRTAN